MSSAAKGVIVYLTQLQHSSYVGRDSLSLLQQSVKLLYRHYNAKHRDDVVFFHNGVPHAAQQEVLRHCTAGTARFAMLAPHHFALPARANRTSWWYPKKFSEGYRHMIRRD